MNADSHRINLDGLLKSSSIFVFMLLLLCSAPSRAQVSIDTAKVDSVEVPQHSPRKASLLSVILPGLGQAYNRKYWKIPLIYAGLGTSLYLIKFNNDYFQDYRKGYISLLNRDTISDPFKGQYTTDQLLNAKEYYRRNRDLSAIVAAGIYVLNIIDATVDAHLFYFDVSDDLALRVQPTAVALHTSVLPAAGLSLTFYMKRKDRNRL
jgi:hypothetical protein